MKLFISVFVSGLLFVSSSALGKIVVKNANFEQVKSPETALHWQSYKDLNSKAGAYQLSQEQANSGKHSVKITGDGSKKDYGFTQSISGFKPGAKLKITTKLFVKDIKQGKLKAIHVPYSYLKDGKKKTTYPGLWVTPDKCQKGKWVTYTFILDLSKHPDVKSFSLWGLGWRDKGKPFIGEAYWDDFSVIELSEENENK